MFCCGWYECNCFFFFMGIIRVLIGHWSNMSQIKDNSFKDWKHTGQHIAKRVNQTTATWIDFEAVEIYNDLIKCAVVLFIGNLKANDWRIDCSMCQPLPKKGEPGNFAPLQRHIRWVNYLFNLLINFISWIECVKWFLMGSMSEIDCPGGIGSMVFRDRTCEIVCHE